ncbi:uncharacterized protein LOC144142962 [Haemaphysalis longicornis]
MPGKAAAVTKPKAPEPEDSSEDDPKTSNGASSNASGSPKEGLGNGAVTRSGLPGDRGGAGRASKGAGGSSSSAAGGITTAGSGSRPTGGDASPGDVATEQKSQAPKTSSEQVAPKKLGRDAHKYHSPTAVTDKVSGGDSSNSPGKEVSANGKSESGTGANKEDSRRNLRDGGTGRRNSSSPAISVNGSGSGSRHGAKNSGPATTAAPQKPQEAPKKQSGNVSRSTTGGGQRGGSVSEGKVEGPDGISGNATGGVGLPNVASESGGGATSTNSRRNSNAGATRGSSGQVPSDRNTVAGAAGASARGVGKPKRIPLSGGRGVDGGSSRSGGSSRRAGRGYTPGVPSSGALGVEDSFPDGLSGAFSGATSDDVLSGPGRGVFPSGLSEGSPREVPSRGPGRGTSGFGGSDFGSRISGTSGLGQIFPAGLGQESAVGSSRISGGSPGGRTFGSADSMFESPFSGSSIGEAGRGAGERPGRAGGRGRSQFSGGLSGGFGESGNVAALPGRGLPRNGISRGSSGPGQEFPEGLGGGSLGESSRGGIAGHRQSTPVPGSSSSGWSGSASGRGSSGLSRGRGKPGAPKTAAAVLGGLAGAAALGAITAGIAAAVQGQGGQSKPKNARQSKPGKRGHSRSCRRRCKKNKLCLAFCRRERRSISESRVPAEILDNIPRNFERLY